MKYLIFIVPLFFYQNSFCQDYVFDSFYEYTSSNNDVKFFMINSTNKNYILCGQSDGASIKGHIYDFVTNEYHRYDVKNSMNSVQFKYLNSDKMTKPFPDVIDNKNQFEYLSQEIDSLNESVTIVKKMPYRKKIIVGQVELIYSKTDADYTFHNLLIPYISYHFFDQRELEKTNNRLPTLITYNYDISTKQKFSYKLTKKEKINTTLTITEE